MSKTTREHGGYSKTGILVNRDRPESDWISIAVPAIISESTFQIAREKLTENKRLSPRNNRRHDYLASGLLHCQECGYALRGDFAHGNGYYRCAGLDSGARPEGRVCHSHPVRLEVIDDLIWDSTKRLLKEPKVVMDEYARRLGKADGEASSYQAVINTKEKELRRLEHEKQRLLDLYQMGSISLGDIEMRLAKLRARIKGADDERKMVIADMERKRGQLKLIEDFQAFQANVSSRLDTLSFQEKKDLVRLLITDVAVDTKKDKIMIKHIIPADKMCRLRLVGQKPQVGQAAFANLQN